jgi:hypothetical protein
MYQKVMKNRSTPQQLCYQVDQELEVEVEQKRNQVEQLNYQLEQLLRKQMDQQQYYPLEYLCYQLEQL